MKLDAERQRNGLVRYQRRNHIHGPVTGSAKRKVLFSNPAPPSTISHTITNPYIDHPPSFDQSHCVTVQKKAGFKLSTAGISFSNVEKRHSDSRALVITNRDYQGDK
jgi:hypothetical protein